MGISHAVAACSVLHSKLSIGQQGFGSGCCAAPHQQPLSSWTWLRHCCCLHTATQHCSHAASASRRRTIVCENNDWGSLEIVAANALWSNSLGERSQSSCFLASRRSSVYYVTSICLRTYLVLLQYSTAFVRSLAGLPATTSSAKFQIVSRQCTHHHGTRLIYNCTRTVVDRGLITYDDSMIDCLDKVSYCGP